MEAAETKSEESETTADDAETEQATPPADEPAATDDDTSDTLETAAEAEAETEQAADADEPAATDDDTSDTLETAAEAETEAEQAAETDEPVATDDDTSDTLETAAEAEAEQPADADEPAATDDDTSDTLETAAEAEAEQAADTESDAPEEEPDAMTQESLEEAYDNSLKAFTDGEIVKGTVVDVNRDEVMIDIGFKSEGYIPAEEFGTDQDDLPAVQVGDEIDVYIVRREDADGQIVLSKKIADQTLIWDEITAAHENDLPVEGRVTERIKGGLHVSVGSLRGFLPASQVELRPVQNLDQYVGEVFQMQVISLSKRRHNIVLSRRAWLEKELAAKKAEVLQTLEVGQLVTGTVKNITDFGAFIDLGGIDGLLHKTDMAWKRIHHPAEVVSVGQEFEVQVIAVNRESEKISLGLKQKTSDPWQNVDEKYPVGSTVQGTVVNIVNYGAFVQLEEAVEGLIHVSEMAWTRRNVAPSRIVNKGDEIEAVVLEISKEDKRISLGIKQLQQNPWELLEQKYPIGTKITGRIRNLTNFGAFVEIEDGIDGLIHTTDLSWTQRVANPHEILQEGEEVDVVVLQIDAAERRVSLGFKQTLPDPWDEVPTKYEIGSTVRGEIVNLTNFGAFTKLEEGIEGLIHISELANRRIERPEDIVAVGEEVEVKVINLDPKNRRIGLSLKAVEIEQERMTTPPEERQRRPRRERATSQHESRRPKPVEEEETVMGALLKKEIGRSNAENAKNMATAESEADTETAETPETADIADSTEIADTADTVETVEAQTEPEADADTVETDEAQTEPDADTADTEEVTDETVEAQTEPEADANTVETDEAQTEPDADTEEVTDNNDDAENAETHETGENADAVDTVETVEAQTEENADTVEGTDNNDDTETAEDAEGTEN